MLKLTVLSSGFGLSDKLKIDMTREYREDWLEEKSMRDEIKALPKDWQALYLNAKSGVVTEAFINYGTFPTEDELYTSEIFYSVSAGIRHDFKLLTGYLGGLLGVSSRERP